MSTVGGQWMSSWTAQAYKPFITSYIADRAMFALLDLVPPVEQNLHVQAGQSGLEECWGGN